MKGRFFLNNGGFAFFRDVQNSEGYFMNHMSWSIEFQGNERLGTAADGDGVVAIMRLRGIETGTVHASFVTDSTFGLDMFETVMSCSLRTGSIEIIP